MPGLSPYAGAREGTVIETTGEDPDGALVEAAAAGDQEAFGVLVRRYEVRIYNVVRASTGGDADSEDLAQEVFIRAFRAIGRFRRDSSFKTWLYAIAANVVRTHLARRPGWQIVHRFWGAGEGKRDADGPADDEPPPDPRDEGFETAMVRRDAIDRALGTLTPDLRLVVTLRDVEGLDYREIAQALGVPIGTVESRLFRARQRLWPLLQPLLGK